MACDHKGATGIAWIPGDSLPYLVILSGHYLVNLLLLFRESYLGNLIYAISAMKIAIANDCESFCVPMRLPGDMQSPIRLRDSLIKPVLIGFNQLVHL